MATSPPADSPAVNRRERVVMASIYAAIVATTVGGFAFAFRFLPASSGGTVPGTLLFSGLGLTAYVLGLRHGFDADHIAAIDNTTRKLLSEGKRPLTVGTWFSLGHSTIVGALVIALVVATEFIERHVTAFASVGALVGTLISGAFLIVLGLINLVIVSEVYGIFRGLRAGTLDERRLNEQLERRGFLYRYFGRLFRVIETPRQIYPVGVLFGLGFDTATEVTLIAISVSVGVSGAVPIWAVLVLPLLFTCGMVLSDTTDGFAMRFAYGWAFLRPIRKVYYNLTLTVISVLVAFVIGGIELLQIVASELGLSAGPWGWLLGLDFETLGFAIAVLFVVTWGIAMAIYRIRGYERTPGAEPPPSASA